MPSLPFLRSSLDRERDRERQRDASRERLPISPPANAASRSQEQQQSAASTPPASSASNTPTRSFSDRLLRRKPSISTKQSGGSLSGKSIPPVPPLSAGLTEYEAGSEPRTATPVGDVFAELQGNSARDGRYGRPADIAITPSSCTTQIPDTHPFAIRNDLRPPTPSSSKSGHSHGPSQQYINNDEPPRSAPPHRFAAPTSPSPNRNTPTPESSNSGRGPSAMAEWLSQKPSRGKLRSASHGSAAARPLIPLPPLPPPSLRHRSSPRVARVSDRPVFGLAEGDLGDTPIRPYPAPRPATKPTRPGQFPSVDEGQSQSDTEGSLDGTAYEVAVACTDTDGEIKWEVTIKPRPPSTAGVSAHSHNLTPALGKSTILAPSNASSINLSLALGQPTGKLVFIQFPTDVSSPTKRRGKATPSAVSSPFAPHARSSTFGMSETPCSPSPARIPVLGATLSSQTFSPEDRPTEPPLLVRPETPPPRMKTPPPLPATPLSDVRTPRRGHARTASRNLNSTPARALQYAPDTPTRTERTSLDRLERSDEGVGISTTLNGELISSPRGSTPRRHRIVSASQLNGGLYAPGTVDGLSEDLESELVLGGELVPPEGRPRTFGGRI